MLHYDRYKNPDAQILNGHVAFRHQGATLYCDSAHFYEMSNSFEAFGHVKMYQGDTLSLFSDYAFYDGNEQMAMARYNVVLKHRKSTLYTDSLNFDRLYNVGYFFEGGKLVDKDSELTSDWGEYYTETKQAVFNYDVQLRNKKFFLTSDTLYYDTGTSVAHAVGPSNKPHIYRRRILQHQPRQGQALRTLGDERQGQVDDRRQRILRQQAGHERGFRQCGLR